MIANRLFCSELYLLKLKEYKVRIMVLSIILFLAFPLTSLLTHGENFTLMSFNLIAVVLTMTVPIMMGLIFNYLYSAESVNLMHALPYTRSQLYTTNMMAGFTIILLPYILNLLIFLVMKVVTDKISLTYDQIFYVMGAYMLVNVVIFTISCCISMIVSQAFLYIGLTYAVLLIPPLIIIMSTGVLMPELLLGYSSQLFVSEILLRVSPLLFVVRFFELYDTGYWLTTGLAWYYIIVVALAFLLGLLLYYRRSSEKSNKWMAFNGTYVLIRILSGITGSFIIGIFFITVTSARENMLLIWLIAGGAIGYVVVVMFVEKTLNVLKRWKCFLLYQCILISIYMGVKVDIVGYEDYIPTSQHIQQIDVETSLLTNIKVINPLEATVANDIDKIMLLHKEMLTNERSCHEEDELGLMRHIQVKIKFTYQLKSGEIVERTYNTTEHEFIDAVDNFGYLKCMRSLPFDKDSVYIHIRGSEGEETIDNKIKVEAFLEKLNKDLNRLDMRNRKENINPLVISFIEREKPQFGALWNAAQMTINDHFKETITWLRREGLYGSVIFNVDQINSIALQYSDGTIENIEDLEEIKKILNGYKTAKTGEKDVTIIVKSKNGNIAGGYVSLK